MKLLVFILNNTDKLDGLVKEFAKNELTGATIIKSSGVAQRLLDSNDETLSTIVGSLKKILSRENVPNNTILMVLKEERVSKVVEIIESVVGDLSNPNTGIVFTLPIDFVKGLKY
ncbi:P-II family nitrogen regulator [Acholeplasma hippikon]|nr:hypothetical protein [Acholeplasma hippikon]